MSKPFEFKDYNKRYKNLSTHNFPTLKNEKLQDSLKFKFTSSAQKGVKLESSVTNVDLNKTNSEFGVKLNFDDVKGVEVGFNAKSDPSLELSFKLDDSLVPLEGSSFTLKGHAKYPSEQTVSGAFAFANKLVNLNLGVTLPITKAGCSILKDDQEALNKQRYKVDFDFVARPVEDRDYYLGGSVKTQLPHKDEELFYTSNAFVGLNNKTTNGGVFVDRKKVEEKVNDVLQVVQETTFGAWVYTEVEDLSGGAKFSYTPEKKGNNSKGFEFELAAGLQRDSDSKLSSKLVVVPQTILSLGYEQKLSTSTKLSFGYAFLVNKSTENSSNYQFGVELTH